MIRVLTIALAATIAAGCATIEHSAQPAQALGQVLLAGPGDVILRVNRQRNLENAFGKADIFGRKTNEGFSELRFAGMEADGVVVLFRKDIHIVSNETTMSRTPLSINTGTATTTGSARASSYGGVTNLTGSTSTTGISTTISSPSAQSFVVPSDSIAVRLQANERRLPVAGFVLEILSASPNALQYRLTQQPQQ